MTNPSQWFFSTSYLRSVPKRILPPLHKQIKNLAPRCAICYAACVKESHDIYFHKTKQTKHFCSKICIDKYVATSISRKIKIVANQTIKNLNAKK